MNLIKATKYLFNGTFYSVFRLNTMAKTMQQSPEKFEGLYQPVLLMSQDASKKNSALKEWRIRSEKLFPDTSLSKFCRQFTDEAFLKEYPGITAKFMVKCFKKAGFVYDIPNEENHLTVNASQCYAYRALDGHEIESGEQITVLSPAWYYGEKIIEHGLSGEI